MGRKWGSSRKVSATSSIPYRKMVGVPKVYLKAKLVVLLQIDYACLCFKGLIPTHLERFAEAVFLSTN